MNDRDPISMNAEFFQRYEKIKPYTLLGDKCIWMLEQYCLQSKNIEGDFAEVGVFKGGSLKIMSDVGEKYNKTIFGFDTFEGLPDINTNIDLHKKGDFRSNEDSVSRLIKENKSTKLVRGFFPSSATLEHNRLYSVVHVDCDLYQSVKDCCVYFFPKLPIGGVMIFNDYGHKNCPGATLAVNEFFKSTKEKIIRWNVGPAIVTKIEN